MVNSSLDFVRTDHKGLTLQITVRPFSSVREDSIVHCTYPAVYNTGMGWRGVGGMCGEWGWGQV